MSETNQSQTQFLSKLFWTIGAILVVFVVCLLLWRAADVLFLIFTGLLFGVCLLRIGSWIAERTFLTRVWAVALVVLLVVGFAVGSFAIFGVQLQQKIVEASKHLDEAAITANEKLRQYPAVRSSILGLPIIGDAIKSQLKELNDESQGEGDDSNSDSQSENAANDRSPNKSKKQNSKGGSDGLMQGAGFALNAIVKVFSTTFGLLMNFFIAFIIAIYFAVNPDVYRNGLLRLFAPERRDRMKEVFSKIETALFRWLLGRFATMIITGASTGLVLWSLGVPMAFTVGVITALLTFIPNVGGVLSLLIASLLALPKGFGIVGAVIGLYCAMQLIESNVITPLIQKRQISMPPALLIGFQAIIGVIFGFIGLMVASPMLAAAMVAINEIYVKDTLKDDDAPDLIGEK